jgi:hypothetical protein
LATSIELAIRGLYKVCCALCFEVSQ